MSSKPETPKKPRKAAESRTGSGTRRRSASVKKIESKTAPKPGSVAGNEASRRRAEHLSNLVRDTLWLFALTLTIYAAVALGSFQMGDPAWSRSVLSDGETRNLGGLFGAYFADVSYYLFGISSWWLVAAAVVWLWKNFRPTRSPDARPYSLKLASAGLCGLLLCSPVLEYALWQQQLGDALPVGAGGLAGFLLGGLSAKLFGSSGSFVITLVLVLLAFSFVAQVSWLDMLENLGARIEWLWEKATRRRSAYIKGQDMPDAKTTRRMVKEAETITAEPVARPAAASSNRKAARLEVTPPVPVQTALFDREGEAVPPPPSGEYVKPALGLLAAPKSEALPIDPDKLEQTAERIEGKLAEFGIDVQVVSATSGPVITRYEIEPAQGVKGSQIVSLSKDLARSMSLQSVRIVETIAGRNTMGIELPNDRRQEVTLREILASPVFAEAKSLLTVALGKDIAGVPVVGDLAKMPHLLVAGMTGSGKSVGVNGMIMSMLFKAKPDEVRFIMIDPKMLELSVYDGIPHLLCPVVTDMREAGQALNWCVAEMEKRYRLLSHLGVRNLAGYNEKIAEAASAEKKIPNPFSLNPDEPEPLEKLPLIVVVIDELADLMMTERKAVEQQIARLAQKARAAGIHLIIATQRPSVDVITGLIKANIPTRMAFTVQSKIDSRTILDQMGAEDLLKYGDLLFLQPGNAEPTRLQGAFVSDHEVHEVVSHIKRQAPADYVDGLLSGEAAMETANAVNPNMGADDLFDRAVAFVIETRKTSISSLQRHLKIGYNRAANMMDALEEAGVVSPADVGGARKVLARKDDL